MKLNLTIDSLMATVTFILSILVFIDQCSARLRPMSSSASLAKVGNLAADHLSALQQTSRKVTKSSVVGINWKNVLLLAGLKAGLVGAGLIKKKVAYKKLKSLKGFEGAEYMNYLNGHGFNYLGGGVGYPLGGYPLTNHFNGKFNKFSNPIPYYDSSAYQYVSSNDDWSAKLPTPRTIDKYSNQQPIIYRKSSLCTDPNHCADYLTSSSITYQLLGTSLPEHLPIIMPATTFTSSATKISPSLNQQPFVLTWVKTPELIAGNNDGASTKFATSSSTSKLNNSSNKQVVVQEKEPDKYHSAIEHHSNLSLNHRLNDHQLNQENFLTHYTSTNASQFDSETFKDVQNQFANNLQFKEPDTHSEQHPEQQIENSNKITSW